MPRRRSPATDSAKNGGTFAHGTATLGSPTEGIALRQSGFDWLDQISRFADEAAPVINSIKGSKDTKPAEAINRPAPPTSQNKTLWIIGGIVGLVLVVVLLKR